MGGAKNQPVECTPEAPWCNQPGNSRHGPVAPEVIASLAAYGLHCPAGNLRGPIQYGLRDEVVDWLLKHAKRYSIRNGGEMVVNTEYDLVRPEEAIFNGLDPALVLDPLGAPDSPIPESIEERRYAARTRSSSSELYPPSGE